MGGQLFPAISNSLLLLSAVFSCFKWFPAGFSHSFQFLQLETIFRRSLPIHSRAIIYQPSSVFLSQISKAHTIVRTGREVDIVPK